MSLGRKREWAEDGPSASPSDVADSAIEHEMKRLRLAYDLSDASAQWTPPDDGDADMEAADGEEGGGADGRDGIQGSAEYAAANALLREMHFLRQLRRFQAARSVAERQQLQQQSHAEHLRDPRY